MNRTITIIDSRKNVSAKAYQVMQFSDGSAAVWEAGERDKHPLFETASDALKYVMELLHQ